MVDVIDFNFNEGLIRPSVFIEALDSQHNVGYINASVRSKDSANISTPHNNMTTHIVTTHNYRRLLRNILCNIQVAPYPHEYGIFKGHHANRLGVQSLIVNKV